MGLRILVAAVCVDAVLDVGHRRHPSQPHAHPDVARALDQPRDRFLDHAAAGAPNLRVLPRACGQSPPLQARRARRGAHLPLRRRYEPPVGLPDPSHSGRLGAVPAVLRVAGPLAPPLARCVALLHGAVRRVAGLVGRPDGREPREGVGVRDRAAAAWAALAIGHELPATRACRRGAAGGRRAELRTQFRRAGQPAVVQHRPAYRASRASARALVRPDPAAPRALSPTRRSGAERNGANALHVPRLRAGHLRAAVP
ncbi:hypothetical protein G6F57_014386 [Rhizopus arrhizus]|nr:hypothetical protein G6F57_014386 [Rhizopus arrhizus]